MANCWVAAPESVAMIPAVMTANMAPGVSCSTPMAPGLELKIAAMPHKIASPRMMKPNARGIWLESSPEYISAVKANTKMISRMKMKNAVKRLTPKELNIDSLFECLV